MKTPHKKGFTLIELLVVISIIGLLASIVLAALNGAKLKAQDARLISEMRSLQTAAELYRSAHGGLYNTNCGNNCDVGKSTNPVYNQTPYLINRGSFSGVGFLNDSTSGGGKLVDDIIILSKSTATPPGNSNSGFAMSPTSYAVTAKLPSNPAVNPYVCVDYLGTIKREPSYATTAFVFACP